MIKQLAELFDIQFAEIKRAIENKGEFLIAVCMPPGKRYCFNKNPTHLRRVPVYDKSKPLYNQILRDSGFKQSLNNELKTKVVPRKSHRNRKIIYYYPSFDVAVKQNIEKLIFDLIKNYFPAEHPFSKIFNNKSIKLSYCCLPYMKQIIQSHNKKLL